MELLDPLKEFSIEAKSLLRCPSTFQSHEWLVLPVSCRYTVKGSVSQIEGSSHKGIHKLMFCAVELF